MKFGCLHVAQEKSIVSFSVAEESLSLRGIRKAATRRLTEHISVDWGSSGAVSNGVRLNLL